MAYRVPCLGSWEQGRFGTFYEIKFPVESNRAARRVPERCTTNNQLSNQRPVVPARVAQQTFHQPTNQPTNQPISNPSGLNCPCITHDNRTPKQTNKQTSKAEKGYGYMPPKGPQTMVETILLWSGRSYRNRPLHPRGACTPCVGPGNGRIGETCVGVS